MNIRLLQSIEDVKTITDDWNSLLCVSNCHRTFSSSEWFLGVVDVYTQLRPWVLLVEEGGIIKGLAPLVLDEQSRRVSLLSDLADYQDFITPKNDEKMVLQLLQAVIDRRNVFDRIVLSGLRRDSILRTVIDDIPSLLLDCELTLTVDNEVSRCFFADLSDGNDVYMQGFSANRRSNYRRLKRRAEDRGIETLELLPEFVSGEVVVEHFLRLHLMRFADKLFSREQPQQFCRRVLPVLFNNGHFRVFVLQAQGQVLAIKLAVKDVNGLGFWNGGFDPEISAIAPGKLLMLHQIKVCFDEGIPVFDMLRGDDAYKAEWATGHNTTVAIELS